MADTTNPSGTNNAYNLNFNASEVMSTSVYKSASGYNYASISIKKGPDEYISVNYEWQGDTIPDLAMDMIGYMQLNKNDMMKTMASCQQEAVEFKDRLKKCL